MNNNGLQLKSCGCLKVTTRVCMFLPRKNNFHPFLPRKFSFSNILRARCLSQEDHGGGVLSHLQGTWSNKRAEKTTVGFLNFWDFYKHSFRKQFHGIQRIPPKNWRMEPENLIIEKGISSSNSFSFWLPWKGQIKWDVHPWQPTENPKDPLYNFLVSDGWVLKQYQCKMIPSCLGN